MLFLKDLEILFAHFPKTGGTSILHWFTEHSNDLVWLDKANCHLDVLSGLHLLQQQDGFADVSELIFNQSFRVLGVVREPFEMLVSLFEFWRRCDPELTNLEIFQAAIQGNFRSFLSLAVVKKMVPNYHSFFWVNGAVWNRTILLSFDNLDSEFSRTVNDTISPFAHHLPRLNSSKAAHSLDTYRSEAGSLIHHVHSHFEWYYDQGQHLLRLPIEHRCVA